MSEPVEKCIDICFWNINDTAKAMSKNMVSGAFIIQIKKSAINIRNKRGPRIKPCGTPNNIFKHSLKMDPIFVSCFRFLRYAEIKAIDFMSKT